MIRQFFLSLLLCVVVLAPSLGHAVSPPWATGQSRGQDLEVVLMTFDHGDQIPTWFGHTALMVRDKRFGAERVYNYGMFSFAPDMLVKFLMGRLEFWVAQTSYRGTIAVYKRESRGIREQVLNLSPEKRLEIAKFLDWNVQPENRYYMYDHYFDNCATRIRDVIDKAVGGQLKVAADKPARYSLRGHTRRHTQRNPYVDFILTFWMNHEIDVPIKIWDEMFLPTELERVLDQNTYVNEKGETVPLVLEKRILAEGKRAEVPESPNFAHPWFAILGAVLGGAGLGLRRLRARKPEKRGVRIGVGAYFVFLGLLVGIPGLILGLFPFTEHTITHWNINLLLASPLSALFMPFGVAIVFGSKRAERWNERLLDVIAVLTIVAILVAPFVSQVYWLPLAFFVPLNLCLRGLGPLSVSRKK